MSTKNKKPTTNSIGIDVGSVIPEIALKELSRLIAIESQKSDSKKGDKRRRSRRSSKKNKASSEN